MGIIRLGALPSTTISGFSSEQYYGHLTKTLVNLAGGIKTKAWVLTSTITKLCLGNQKHENK